MAINDALGDLLKQIEKKDTGRFAEPGECIMVRLDGNAFSTFTSGCQKPYDAVISSAMKETAVRLLTDYNPEVVYTQSDEITLLFKFRAEKPFVFGGKLVKFASVLASKASAYFNHALMSSIITQVANDQGIATPREAIDRIEEMRGRISQLAPSFDGRAVGVEPELAVQFLVWRELDARRNAAIMAGLSTFTQAEIAGKGPGDIKDMLAAKGVDFYGYPPHFRKGSLFRKRDVELTLSEEELARMPEKAREYQRGKVYKRSRPVELENTPPFYAISNMEEFIFDDAEPTVADRAFAQHITP